MSGKFVRHNWILSSTYTRNQKLYHISKWRDPSTFWEKTLWCDKRTFELNLANLVHPKNHIWNISKSQKICITATNLHWLSKSESKLLRFNIFLCKLYFLYFIDLICRLNAFMNESRVCTVYAVYWVFSSISSYISLHTFIKFCFKERWITLIQKIKKIRNPGKYTD